MKKYLLTLLLLFSLPAYAGHSVGNIDDSVPLERVTLSLDGKLYAWDGNGNVLPNWPIDLASAQRSFILTPRLVDLDGDSRLELLVVSQGEGNSLRLHVYNGLAQELARWSRDISVGGASLTATPLIADINADNAQEIIFSARDGNIFAIGLDGNSLAGFPQNLGSAVQLAAADLENNGRPRLFGVAGDIIFIWNLNETGNQLESSPFFATGGAQAIGELMVADINNDSFNELIFSTSQNNIYIVDRRSEILRTIPVSDGPLLSQVAMGDVDLDGNPDILAILSDGTKVAFKANGSPLNQWLREIEYRQYHEPSVGRIVNDIYNGAFNSATGLDFYTTYLSQLKTFAVFELGRNVHEIDRHALFYFAQAAAISGPSARPLVFTPNGDGTNDTTELHYDISQSAAITINLLDSNNRLISTLVRESQVGAGHQVFTWDGIDQKDTRTSNDDEPIESGLYVFRITAATQEGLTSQAETNVIVFGMNAKIEFPNDEERVFGTIAIRGVASDPNIGENNSGFDFNSYKLYFRPGRWEVSPGDVATVGLAGSEWQTIPVPLRLQSPLNVRNEPNDVAYPNSNVGVSPVQHGLLGTWNTASLTNGVYTVLLKVIEGDLASSPKMSYDQAIVNVLNQMASGEGGSEGGGQEDGKDSNDSDDEGGAAGTSAPIIGNINPANSEITERVRQANISYTLTGKPSDINITIYRVGGAVVYTQSFLNRAADRTYSFSWNGTDSLGRTIPNGFYSVRITATAIDGFGQDEDDSARVNVNINDALSQNLSVVHFASSLEDFNPLDSGVDLPERSTAITYVLNKPSRVSLEIFDESGVLRKQLLTNHLSQNSGDNPPVWDGTDLDGLILPFGKYVARLTAIGTEVGREETVTEEIPIILSSPEYDDGLTANVALLVGDGKSNPANDQERGILVNNDNPEDDFPLEGNPDFYWTAFGNGNVALDLEYNVRGQGTESYSYATEAREERNVSFTADIPDCFSTCKSLDGCCPPGDTERSGDFTYSDGGVFNNWGFTVLGGGVCYDIIGIAYDTNGNEVGRINAIPHVGVGQTASRSGCANCQRLHYWIESCEDGSTLNVQFFMIRQTTSSGERAWGPTETGFVSRFGLTPGTHQIGSFPLGSIGTQAGDVVAITSQNYSYEVRELLNNEYRTSSFGTCEGGVKHLPFADIWMGTESNPDTSDCVSHIPNIFANITQSSFSTSQDTALENGRVRGLFANFNENDYRTLSDPITIYDHYSARESHPDLYTFSNIVRIRDWDVALRYPNGDLVDAFETVEKEIHGEASMDQDGNGIPNVSDNVLDTFRLKLKPDAVPRRFIEIRGNVETTNYQLKYYDSRHRLWMDIPVQLSPVREDGTQTLGWWDVTQLNGENYTVLLRVENEEGQINESTMNVGIGRRVQKGEVATIRSAFGRAALHFDGNTLGSGSSAELISVTPVPNNDPLLPPLHLPSGTIPVGPVYNLQPDGIDIDPAHPVQFEITYSCEEVWNAFGNNPAEITIYNLKNNGELEIVSTINPSDNTCDSPDPNEFFRITGQLEHFSTYVMLKEGGDIPSFSIMSPENDGLYSSPLRIAGQISGPELELLRVSYFSTDDPLRQTTDIYEGTSRNFDFSWEANIGSGAYTLLFEVLNTAGLSNSLEIPIQLDTEASLTRLLVDGTIIPEGQMAFLTDESAISFVAEEARNIQYSIDQNPFVEYTTLFTLAGQNVGNHEITYRSFDDAGNREADRKVTLVLREEEVPAGNTNIETSVVVNGPAFEDAHEVWVSPQSQLVIGATLANNELAFINHRYFGGEWARYSNPISLDGLGEGVYALEYFGTDIYERNENVRKFNFTLDKTPPVSSLQINDRVLNQSSPILVGNETQISLTAVDPGKLVSGLQKIEYRFGEGTWQTYATPFTAGGQTNLQLQVRAVDRVENIEAAQIFQLERDTGVPQLTLIFSETSFSPNADSLQDTARFEIEIGDNFSTTLFYTLSVNGSTAVASQSIGMGMQTVLWDGTVNGSLLGEGIYPYELYVEDEAGNRSESIRGNFVLDVTPPQVEWRGSGNFQAGVNGASIGYSINDNLFNENIQINFAVTSGPSTLAMLSETVSLPPNEKTIAWNGLNQSRNTLPDGSYLYRLSARDAAGNASQPLEGSLSYDAAAPVTRLKFSGAQQEGWINASTQLILEASDYGMGVASTYYRVDGSVDAVSYLAPFVITASGEHALGFWSLDLAGNQESEKTATVKIDSIAPQTEVLWSGIHNTIDGINHVSGAASQLTLQSQDEHSGVDRIMMQIDSYGAQVYRGAFNFRDLGDGPHSVKYWAADKAGNIEEARDVSFILHGRPPEVSVTFGNPQYVGSNLFITSQTPVQVQASSNSRNIDVVSYQIDSNAEVRFDVDSAQNFNTPEFNIPAEGIHTLSYRVADDYQNQKILSRQVGVDNTPPETTLNQSQQVGDDVNWVSPSTVFSIGARDNLSGVKTTEYSIDGGAWQPYAAAFTLGGLSDGTHVISFKSEDHLGNPEQTQQQNVEIVSIDASLALTDAPRILICALANQTGGERGATELFVEELLASQPWHYAIVKDPNAFIRELRSDIFDTVLMVSDEESFRFANSEANVKMFKELTERIYNGASMLLFTDPDSLSGEPWEIMFKELKPLSENVETGRFEIDLLGLGKGKVAPFKSNPAKVISSLDSSDRESARKELYNLLSIFRPGETKFSPLEVIGLDVIVRSKEGAVNVGAQGLLSQGVQLISALGSGNNKADWEIDLEPRETKHLRFLVRLPEQKQTVAFKTDVEATWENGLVYNLQASKEQAMEEGWEVLWQDAVLKMRSIPEAVDFIALFEEEFRRDNLESKIDLILSTVANLGSLEEREDIKELRYQLDETLEVLAIHSADIDFSIVPPEKKEDVEQTDQESDQNNKKEETTNTPKQSGDKPGDSGANQFTGGGGGCHLNPSSGSSKASVVLWLFILLILGIRRRAHLFVIVILFLSAPSLASDTGVSGFNIHHFRPVADGSGIFSLYGSETLGHLRSLFRLNTSVNGDLIEAGNPATNGTTDLINTLWTNDLAAAFGIKDFINIGVNLPLHFYESGFDAGGNGFQTTSLGDMGLEGKIHLLDENKSWLGGAALLRLTLPTGERAKFTGHDNPTVELKTIADKYWKDFYFAANVGYKFIDRKPVRTIANGALWNVSDNDRLTFGAGAKYSLPWQKRSWSASLQISGETVLDQTSEVTTPVELLAGVQKRLNEKMSLEGGFGRGLTNAIGSPSYRVFAGLTYHFDSEKRKVKRKKEEKQSAEPKLLHTVYFLFDSSELTPKKQHELEMVVQKLKDDHYSKLILRGHADTWGEDPYNEGLSLQRALVVKEFLKSKGMEQVTVESYGASNPVVKKGDYENQPKNRRVEVLYEK